MSSRPEHPEGCRRGNHGWIIESACHREHWSELRSSLPAERDVVHSLSDTKGSDDTTTPAAPAERDEPESFNRCAWAAWIGPERDGDGQATTIHVAPTDGAHVTEADAEVIRAALREAASPSVEISVLHLSWAIDDHAMVMATEPTHDGGTCTTDCAGDIRARYLTRERNGQ